MRSLDADCCASNATDVLTANAEVCQFAVAHAAQFSYGLTVLAPVVQRASDVHDRVLRFVSERRLGRRCFDFLRPNIIGLGETKTDNEVCHLCIQRIATLENAYVSLINA